MQLKIELLKNDYHADIPPYIRTWKCLDTISSDSWDEARHIIGKIIENEQWAHEWDEVTLENEHEDKLSLSLQTTCKVSNEKETEYRLALRDQRK